ncbi:MAG: hypothetical protein J07HX5_00012 [halophilic archaeon J07HX5]|jgi:hypothetical protein|nr:MAG: hypothetical protein J07HX5_00012 [halophilic archaeon J07HX5]
MTDSNIPQHTRRRYLATVGTAIAAGCSGDTPSEVQPSQNTTHNPNQSSRNGSDLTILEDSEGSLSDVVSPGNVTYGDDPNWRMHGHDTGNSFINPHADGPSGSPSVQWTFERDIFPTGSLIHHQPLIVDGTVYTYQFNVSARDHTPVKNGNIALIRIDAKTGESETVFTTNGIREKSGTVTGIVISDGIVYLAGLGAVQAHDLDTGNELWTIRLNNSSIGVPTGMRIADDVLVVTDHQHSIDPDTREPTPRLCAVDLDTGDPLWTAPGRGRENDSVIPSFPLVADGLVHHPDKPPIRDLRSGEKLATLPAQEWPSLHDRELYGIVNQGDTTRLMSHSWETGHQRWEYVPEKADYASCHPVVVDDTVVIIESRRDETIEPGESPGRCTGVNRETGERQWSVNYTSKAESEELFWAGFRIADSETVYIVHNGGAATAIDPTDGSIQWQVIPNGWQAARGGALAEDLLVTVGRRGTLYGIR